MRAKPAQIIVKISLNDCFFDDTRADGALGSSWRSTGLSFVGKAASYCALSLSATICFSEAIDAGKLAAVNVCSGYTTRSAAKTIATALAQLRAGEVAAVLCEYHHHKASAESITAQVALGHCEVIANVPSQSLAFAKASA